MPTMTAITAEPFFKGSTGKNTRGLLRLIILCLIAAAAVASRLFSVIRTSASPIHKPQLLLIENFIGFESIIHECQCP